MGEKDDCAEKLRHCENETETLRSEKQTLQREKDREVAICREKIKRLESAKEKSNVFLLKLSISLRLVKETLVRITYNFAGGKRVEIVIEEKHELDVGLELEEESKAVSKELTVIINIMSKLENNVLSLTEENTKINSLLKIALVAMEAVEKSLSRLNENIEQKRAAILQIVESGLQRVGFGSGENSLESSGTKVDTSSDSSECEEEVVSLASTVVRIMKNLNLKITQLRRSLEESRLNNEHLQSLTEKQAQDIVEKMLYLKKLEDRERMLAQNVEGLLMKVKEAEAEVARWREACELEIESGKHEIEQRDKVVLHVVRKLAAGVGESQSKIYRKKVESLESENKKSEERIESLESAKKESEKKIKNLESEKEQNKTEAEIYKERIKSLESAKEKIEKEEESYRERIKNLESAKEKSEKEEEIYRERIKSLESAKEKCDGFMLKLLKSLRLTEKRLVRIINNIVDKETVENYTKESDGLELDGELKVVSEELMAVTKLTKVAELKVNEYKESRKKEKRGLESDVLSLTEENRNIYCLLKIALVAMEAVEKKFSRLKGNIEQKRVAISQIAESGLQQKVGFESVGTKLDSSEGEEEVVSLASTVERIMKNLNIEITQLRRSLEESRSNTERLQSLTEKQAQDIAENMLYIKELEDREKKLAQNVEELLMKIKEIEAEVSRWREACELEVEAGKREIKERNKVVAILSQELEKTKTALDISNRKLNEKEELATTAMAAQSAAEKSLQLADSTAAGLCKQVEELSKQLEEVESRDRNRRKTRHICGPWRAPKLSTTTMNNRVKNVRRMLSKCKPWRALKLSNANKDNKVKNERRMLPKYKKDAVKLRNATMNSRVKNVRRMLSKCKPWRTFKLSTANKDNKVKNERRMLSN